METGNSSFCIRPMEAGDVAGAVSLQRACFPPPFPEALLWTPSHLRRHLETFPAGQFVAEAHGEIVASASAMIVPEAIWRAHLDWKATTGGLYLEAHDPKGSTLYGVDVSVHPDCRGKGIARALYRARFEVVKSLRLARFGTACRIPGYRPWNNIHKGSPEAYALAVVAGRMADRTLTPLLKCGMAFVGILKNYMEDEESADCAALLEWTP